MKTSVYAVLVAAVVYFGVGCNDRTDELQKQNASLQSSNTELNAEIASRDEYVSNVTDSINEVYMSIENLKAKEASLLTDANGVESKQLTSDQVRARLSDRLVGIRTALSDDHKRIRGLQSKLSDSKKQYAGLQSLVDNLNKTLAERDQSIADLGKRVDGLEQDVHGLTEDVSLKNMMLGQRDSVIGVQHNELTTAYYVSGTREELEKMGVIRNEGGFLWGWIGATTTMSNGFDPKYFKPIDNNSPTTIQVNGQINEIVPKRTEACFHEGTLEGEQTTLTISDPQMFWKQKYLVIVTDRPGTSAVIAGFVPIVH